MTGREHVLQAPGGVRDLASLVPPAFLGRHTPFSESTISRLARAQRRFTGRTR